MSATATRTWVQIPYTYLAQPTPPATVVPEGRGSGTSEDLWPTNITKSLISSLVKDFEKIKWRMIDEDV